MEIFYDGAIYSVQQHGGVNRYFKNLIQRLSEQFAPTLVVASDPLELPEHRNLSVEKISAGFGLERVKSLRRSVEAWKCRRRLRQSSASIVHPTYYRTLARDCYRSTRLPVVVTVYDFIHERFQDHIRHSARQIAWKKTALERADRLICISDSTLADLDRFYPALASKAVRIHLGCEFSPAAGSDSQHACTDEYFLFVGGRGGYKNFEVMIRAMQRLIKRNKNRMLKCVGADFDADERAAIGRAGVTDNIQSVGRVSDAALQQLYQHSLAFVYPSRYEGFGIPLLEAMNCGCPIIASNRSSLPEVTGEAGILFEPDDDSALAEAMLELAARGPLRQTLIHRGRERAKHFTWGKMSAATEQIYRDVA